MPLTFPSSPTNNQTYTVGARTWTYNGTIWELSATAVGFSSVGENELTPDAVTTAKIANSAITTAKISNSSVTVAKIESNPTFTGTVTLPSTTSIGNVSSTEIGYVDGVTSAIQTQIDTKSPLASPTFTGTVVLPATTSIGNVSNAEISYIDGVTSAIQTQLDSKLTATTATTSNRNVIINGDFKLWQRSTDATIVGAFGYATADRWQSRTAAGGGSMRTSRQLSGLTGFQYCARAQRTSGNTIAGGIQLIQTLETVNSIPLAAKTVTLSFYARKGSNYSATSNILGTYLYSGTGTDQAWHSFTGLSTLISQSSVLTDTWQRFSYSATVPSGATQIYMLLSMEATGTAGANDYFEVTGVQLEAGAVATPFEFEDYGITLAKCKRYYQRVSFGVNTYTGYYSGNGSIFGIPLTLPVEMRTAPAISYVSTLGGAFYWVEPGITPFSADSTAGLSLSGTTTSFMIQQARQAGGAAMVARTSYVLEASAVFAASAEL